MIKKVLKTIKVHNLISSGDRVLLALSGGSDSVCLLYVLNELKGVIGFELFACHLNHSIRNEADGDEEFVKKLCEGLGIECFTKKVDIPHLAKENKISEELCGREERYKFFDELLTLNNLNLIATAHNRNDVAETVLMHLIRGAGIDGLTGIKYKRDNIIRPLLDAKKEEIEKYCQDNNIEFRIDKTNNDTVYTRNRIRHELLPVICEKFNPSFLDVLASNSENIAFDADYIQNEAEKAFEELVGKLKIDRLQKLHPAILRRVIIKCIKDRIGAEQNIQNIYIDSIAELIKKGKSGSSLNIGNNIKCIIESGVLVFKNSSEKKIEYSYPLTLNEKVLVCEAGISVILKEWSGDGEKFYFDQTDNLTIRNKRIGDCFYPKGMTGKKKLSDYFTDAKVPLSERELQPIIFSGNELVWIVGKRRDRRFLEGKKAYTFIINQEENKT